jgi:hypothetical protein
MNQDEEFEDLAELLSAVERFEAAVEAHGGDVMVDDLKRAPPGATAPSSVAARLEAST